MNEEGELIGVKDTVKFEERQVADEEERKKHEEELLSRENNTAANISNELIETNED